MEINDLKYGFKLVEIEQLKDINVTMYRFLHLKSNATVIHFSCDDVDKAFAIGFKTVPVDSSGVCHILEHSVLCGSKKYPLKEPFVNLLKTSLSTFLNAFTSSDWTMYPFASANDKDFNNILDIYLDAVFNPLILTDKKAFLQEGWHLELFDKNSLPSYKGVVYNEMKGALSSVNRILMEETSSEMFKDTTYHFNSGGDPKDIINLTYEKYKEFYYKHYRPENALTFFYGDMDIEEKLKFLDENYFCNYTKSDEVIEIKDQKPLISLDKVVEYSINEGESLNNNTYISLCYSLGDYSNYSEYLALNILFDALLSSNDSPVTKALLDNKLGEDISYYVDDSSIIPTLNIQLQKTNLDKKEEFRKVFINKIKELRDNGIDKELLLAKINRNEFINKEQNNGSFPKGISFAINCMSAFNYHLDYKNMFEFNSSYKMMKEKLNSNYFENLLDKYILNSSHYVSVSAVPSLTLANKEKLEMEEKMKKIKESMTDKEIDELIKVNKELLEYQNHKDSKKELKCLPTLSIKDLRKDVYHLNTNKTKINGINGIYHKVNTNNISYLSMYFNVNKICFEDLKYIYLLSEYLLNVPTKNYSVLGLQNVIETYLGSFYSNINFINNSRDDYQLYFSINASALDENVSYIPVVFNEVLLHSKFNKKDCLQILKQTINNMKRSIVSNGNTIAFKEINSMFSYGHAVNNCVTSSIKLYKELNDLLNNFNFNELKNKLKDVCYKLFNKKNCFVSISGNEYSLSLLKENIKNIKLPRKEYQAVLVSKLSEKKNKFFVIPSKVNYNAIGYNFSSNDVTFGNLTVLKSIVSLDYLWNEVRVKGGAYGCSMGLLTGNDLFFSSYRDPNVKNTFDSYYNVLDYVNNLKLSKKELESYIIGSCASYEKPFSTPTMIKFSDTYYFMGLTKKERLNRKKNIIKTSMDDIHACSKVLKEVINNSARVTLGNKDNIDVSLFDEIINL